MTRFKINKETVRTLALIGAIGAALALYSERRDERAIAHLDYDSCISQSCKSAITERLVSQP